MKSRWSRRLLPVVMLLALAGAASAQQNARTQGPPPPAPPAPFLPNRWWRDLRKELNLTDEQSRRIDVVVQTTMPALRPKVDELEMLEAELSRLIKADADEGTIAKQADKVEAIRAMLNKNRTLMLVRIRAVLTPEQRMKLNALRDQWDAEHQPPPRQNNDRDRQNQRPDAPRPSR